METFLIRTYKTARLKIECIGNKASMSQTKILILHIETKNIVWFLLMLVLEFCSTSLDLFEEIEYGPMSLEILFQHEC